MVWSLSEGKKILLVVLVAILVTLPRLGEQILIRQQELRVALSARNMVESGE